MAPKSGSEQNQGKKGTRGGEERKGMDGGVQREWSKRRFDTVGAGFREDTRDEIQRVTRSIESFGRGRVPPGNEPAVPIIAS
jgi:hypothetical protein